MIGTFLVALDMVWLLANMPESPLTELINSLPNAIGLVFGMVLLPGDVVHAAQLLIRMDDDQLLLPFKKVGPLIAVRSTGKRDAAPIPFQPKAERNTPVSSHLLNCSVMLLVLLTGDLLLCNK